MIRFLDFKRNGHMDGIISGDVMRDIIEVFPELKEYKPKKFETYLLEKLAEVRLSKG